MSNTSLLGSFGGQAGESLMFRNHLINGCFRVWQRGTSQTSTGYESDDRWLNLNGGSTKTHSQQPFILGQTDVPGNPQFFSRTVVSSVVGAGNYTTKHQKVESVRTLAGQTATLSFWAKADAPKNMAVEFYQEFGNGGSPSAAVSGIGVTTIALTASWKYYTVTVNIPSISGKTLGTNNDDNVQVIFWFDAGSTFNARTNSLGQQSGTFDIANAMLEAGPTATPFERRPIGTELALCQRYYWRESAGASSSYKAVVMPLTTTRVLGAPFCLPVSLRNSSNVGLTVAHSGVVLYNYALNSAVNVTNIVAFSGGANGTNITLDMTCNALGGTSQPYLLALSGGTGFIAISAEL